MLLIYFNLMTADFFLRNPTKEELRASHFGRSSLHPQGHEFEKPLQREGKATQPDDRWLDSKDRHERYTIQENQKKKEAFFCGGTCTYKILASIKNITVVYSLEQSRLYN